MESLREWVSFHQKQIFYSQTTVPGYSLSKKQLCIHVDSVYKLYYYHDQEPLPETPLRHYRSCI
uniref:Uncharacterized protein n=1 Tax=Lepeophtheirus salmonis TaxID=72036 RepID=A0A0K2SYY2_LEPSM